ncbi:MAG: hypothetical protein KA275_07630 [Chitinophagaceae bacterium]|nr:hypothetical protein [Chitinophagaceae bacterium]
MSDFNNLIDNEADIQISKPSRAKFLFLLGFLGFFIFFIGCNYGHWTHTYSSNADVKVQKSTLLTPEYE